MAELESISITSFCCRFCQGRVGTEHGQLQKLERHMENCHDMYYDKDFTLVLNFLSDEEIKIIVEKIQPRIDNFKKYGFLEHESNIFASSKSKQETIFVENSLTLTGDDDSFNGDTETDIEDDTASVSNKDNLETMSKLERVKEVEKQQAEILSLLESDDEEEMHEKRSTSSLEPNPVNKIRRRIYSEEETPPVPGAFEIKLQLSGSILRSASESADEDTDCLRDQNSKKERSDLSYIDIQRKKIENILCSDEEDSDKEESNKKTTRKTQNGEVPAYVSEEEDGMEMQNVLQESEENEDEVFEPSSNIETDASIPFSALNTIKGESSDAELNLLLHATLDGLDPTSSSNKNHIKQESDKENYGEEDNTRPTGVTKQSNLEEATIDGSKSIEIETNDYDPDDTSDQIEVDLDPNDLENTSDQEDGSTECQNPIESNTSHYEEVQDESEEVDPLSLDSGAMDLSENREDDASQENIEDRKKGSNNYDHINLVPSFKSRNFCRLCYANPGSQANLQKHEEEVHHDEKGLLEKEFFSVADLVYKCSKCPHIPGFLSENLLLQHKVKEHKHKIIKPKKFKCEVCEAELSTQSKKSHMALHSEEKNYQCNLCSMNFKLEIYLKKHMRIHLKDEAKTSSLQKATCKLCYTECSNRSNLLSHLRRHVEDKDAINRDITEDDLKFECNKCGLKFISDHLRGFHFNRNHRSRDSSKSHHELKKTGNPLTSFETNGRKYFYTSCHLFLKNGRYKCNLCYLSYKASFHLFRHLKHIHKEDKGIWLRSFDNQELTVQCPKCDLKFFKEGFMVYHKQVKHEITRKRKINKVHSIKSEEKINQKAEENLVRTCNLCYLTYSNVGNLWKHQNKIHKNDKDFLNRKIEIEDLKFKCIHCDKSFVKDEFKQYHIKMKHLKEHKATVKSGNNTVLNFMTVINDMKDSS